MKTTKKRPAKRVKRVEPVEVTVPVTYDEEGWFLLSEAMSFGLGLVVFAAPLMILAAWVPVLTPVCAVIGFLIFMIGHAA